MNAMNPINEIFLRTIQLHDAKWFQFIKKYKLREEIENLQQYLLYSQDVFAFSDEFFTVYNSIPVNIKLKYHSLINIENSFMRIDGVSRCRIIYIPKDKEFRITDIDYGNFTVRKDTGVSGSIRMTKWKELQDRLKLFYLETIMDTADALAQQE